MTDTNQRTQTPMPSQKLASALNDFLHQSRDNAQTSHATQPAEVTDERLLEIGREWTREVGWYEFEVNDFIGCARAILSLRPVQVPMTDEPLVNNPTELPKGFIPLQSENGKLVYAACLDGGRFHGWLMWKHPGGQWVTKRKMEPWEVMQAEDQDHYGIVQESPHHGITAQAKKE